ncbi:MAG: seg [Parcubacteria group bacterium]|nr:seg [Parcubacteria group bacterium]
MKKILLSALAFAPAFAFAQSGPQLGGIFTLMNNVKRLVDLALPLVVGLALLGFFWGLMKFIFAAADEEKRKEARQIMIYGVIALFVMVAVWGLVGFVGNALGIAPGQDSGHIPTVQGL